MEQKLKELHWSTDRLQIEKILHHLNPKYLLGRLEAHNKNRNYGQEYEDHSNGMKYVVCIKYDGCTFTCSKSTLEKECMRRCVEGTMTGVTDYRLLKSKNRCGRYAAIHKDGMIETAK